MAIPDRPTVETQVWPGQVPVPPWDTQWGRLGLRGLDLVSALDTIPPEGLSRQVNMISRAGGPLRVRPGMGAAALATTIAGARVHSLYRLNDPLAGVGSFTRLAGSGTDLYRGTTGALTLLDAGYSGDPLTFCGVTVPLTGVAFCFVGDRTRNRKVARTGAVTPIGLPAATLTSTALGVQLEQEICQFEVADANGPSAAANWTYTAGVDRAGTPVAAPTGADVLGAGNMLVQVTTNPAGAAANTGYDSIVSIARTLNLNQFSGGAAATDDDIIFIAMNISDPSILEEVKIYFVTSTFTAGAIPGNSANNSEAFFKAFGPNDFTAFHEREESSIDASETLRKNTLLEDFKQQESIDDGRSPVVGGITEISRLVRPTFPAGRNVWGEWGVQGVPLRRGDFSRIGFPETTASNWGTVTGIVIVIQTNTNQSITWTSPDLWALRGGSGPDTMEPDASAYDYRVTNYHTLTGAEGNPSAIQAATAFLNPMRQPVTITPGASGLASVVQRAYRRGGSAASTTDWFFVGQSAADGGVITDTSTDDTAVAEASLEIDNDQPVTSVDAAGATVLAQPVPIYFMVEDVCFACGDALQPGRLYRSKKGRPESWPATNYQDVCAASEELMNGGQYGSAGFVFSRSRLYSILLSPDDNWTTDPTACAEGLVSRWALAVTPYGLAFVSPFGVRLTTGQAPEPIGEAQIGPLFRGIAANGFAPVDLTNAQGLQLAYHDHDLWLTYLDTSGGRRQLVYNFFDKTWRSYLFSPTVACVYSEPVQGAAGSLLLGSQASGQIGQHGGFSDFGGAIPYTARTGAWDFGVPRNEKLLSEILVDGDLGSTTLTVQAFTNLETTSITAQAVVGVNGDRRYSFEPFGVVPFRARTVSVELRGDAPLLQALVLRQVGVSRQLLPEITENQPSPWEELPGGEGYVWGCMITCDTGGATRTVLIETTTNNGAVTTVATLSINASGRKKLPFSWTAALAQQIRLRPTGTCEPWIRYKIEWFSDPEPPRVLGWDTNWEDFGTLSDKWLKGYLLEADSFGAAKTVVVDIDQSPAVDSRALTFTGRGIQHISFAKQRGRLFRLRSTDNNFGKFYRWQPIFDEEPLSLTRWQTQERPHEGMQGRWQKPLEAFLSLRSSGTVTLQITCYGLAGATLNTSTYPIATTAGAKVKVRVPLNAVKGLLFEYLLTAAAGFWIYREESELLVEDFNSGEAKWVPLLPSNDDLDPSRNMGNARVAASTPGGA